MHIFAAIISFFSQFPGGVCPTMAPSITHVMLLANKLGYLQMYNYIHFVLKVMLEKNICQHTERLK